jgi:class 3 adenylate cyclase
MENVITMAFLFDVADSTKKVHSANRVEQKIFYGLIESAVNSVLKVLPKGIRIIKSTGDGYYICSPEPDHSILLFVELSNAFESVKYKDEPIHIKCGASYGNTFLSNNEITGDLPNVVARCCSNALKGELVITETLKNLIADSTYINNYSLSLEPLTVTRSKGCEDVKMWKLKKNNNVY